MYTPEQARLLSGITATAMAEELGVSVSTLRAKEQGLSDFSVREAKVFAEKTSIPAEEIDFLWAGRSRNRT